MKRIIEIDRKNQLAKIEYNDIQYLLKPDKAIKDISGRKRTGIEIELDLFVNHRITLVHDGVFYSGKTPLFKGYKL